MKRDLQGIVLVLVGAMILRLAVGDQFLFYVSAGMRPWLLLSGVALIILGAYQWWELWREGRSAGHHDDQHTAVDADGHDHTTGPRVAYLLLIPVLAVYLVIPSALGSFSAARQTTTSTAPAVDARLPAVSGDPATMPLRDYVVRAVWDSGRTLRGHTVELTGFVTPNPEGGWWLTRMAMTCCAADAQASRIAMVGAPAPAADAWVTVTGTWTPGGGLQDPTAIPLMRADRVHPVAQPRDPYE
ncbi:MAG: TIGR03943 family protein [Candidatus Nanopelagicales bacterium]